MATMSVHKGTRIAREHNLRTQGIADREIHIHAEGEQYVDVYGNQRIAHNEVWHDEEPHDACDRLFGEALEEYNAKQRAKHPERVIDDYIKKIENTKDMHFAYEMIYGVYLEDESINEELQREILQEVYYTFEERNPNFKVIGAYYHADEEGQPHLHLDYIPIGYNNKQGLKVQCSQNKALSEMGYTMQKGDKEKGIKAMFPIVQWENDERAYLIDLAKRYGIDIQLTKEGKEHEADKRVYIAERKAEQAEKQAKMLTEQYEEISNQYHKAINTQKEILSEVKQDICHSNAENDQIKRSIENSIQKLAETEEAVKKAENDLKNTIQDTIEVNNSVLENNSKKKIFKSDTIVVEKSVWERIQHQLAEMMNRFRGITKREKDLAEAEKEYQEKDEKLKKAALKIKDTNEVLKKKEGNIDKEIETKAKQMVNKALEGKDPNKDHEKGLMYDILKENGLLPELNQRMREEKRTMYDRLR